MHLDRMMAQQYTIIETSLHNNLGQVAHTTLDLLL